MLEALYDARMAEHLKKFPKETAEDYQAYAIAWISPEGVRWIADPAMVWHEDAEGGTFASGRKYFYRITDPCNIIALVNEPKVGTTANLEMVSSPDAKSIGYRTMRPITKDEPFAVSYGPVYPRDYPVGEPQAQDAKSKEKKAGKQHT
jgi:hypothetical protein